MIFFIANILHWFKNEISLEHIEALMGTWGYPLLFGLLFSCGLGVPLPEDIPLLLAGYFIANGKMNLMIAAIAAWCGIIGGDCVLYTAGRRYGLNITKVPILGKHFTAQRIALAERLFQKYGVAVVGIGRMFAGIRGAMVVAAGAIRYNFFHFLIADGIGAIFSGGLFMALGYWAGTKLGNLNQLREKIGHYEYIVLIGLIIIVVLIVVFSQLKKKAHAPIDSALEKVIEQTSAKAPGAESAG